MMADLFPTDPKRIRERIRRYERALKRELEEGYTVEMATGSGICWDHSTC